MANGLAAGVCIRGYCRSRINARLSANSGELQSCFTAASARLGPRRLGRRLLLLVFEADLQVDAVLDNLAALDAGRRLDHLYRSDVANRLGGDGDGLARRVAPRARAHADHLSDDDHAHRTPPLAGGPC